MTTAKLLNTPIGRLAIVARGDAITEILFDARSLPAAMPLQDTALLCEAAGQLEEYFAGTRREFDLPLAAAGTEFEKSVWAALREIPYGETRSYGEVAASLGQPGASRAVGRANGKNPLPIVVPCHRVVGRDGSLTGFGGGLKTKQALLMLEGIPLQTSF